MEHFVVLETTGQKDNYKTELQKLYSAIDTELGEVDQHFRAQHTTHSFTCCFDPVIIEKECVVTKQFICTQTEKETKER